MIVWRRLCGRAERRAHERLAILRGVTRLRGVGRDRHTRAARDLLDLVVVRHASERVGGLELSALGVARVRGVLDVARVLVRRSVAVAGERERRGEAAMGGEVGRLERDGLAVDRDRTAPVPRLRQ